MNTEFNIADLEKALAFIKANPIVGGDDPEHVKDKPVTVAIFERLFIEGAELLAVAIADGLTEDEIKSRMSRVKIALLLSSFGRDHIPEGIESVKFVNETFDKVGERHD